MQLDYETPHIVPFPDYDFLQAKALLISAAIILALLISAAIILALLISASLISATPNSAVPSPLSRLMSPHFHRPSCILQIIHWPRPRW